MASTKAMEWLLYHYEQELKSHWDTHRGTIKSKVRAYIALLPSRMSRSVPIRPKADKKSTIKRRGTIMGGNKIHPEKGLLDPELKELQDNGIDISKLNTLEDQWQLSQSIKRLPCNFETKKRLRSKLMQTDVDDQKGCCVECKHSFKSTYRGFKAWLREMEYKLELWGSMLRKIEGHQGTGVLSYFTFLVWLFKLNVGLFTLILLFITFPYVIFSSDGYTYAVKGDGISGVSDANTATCSALYKVNVSTEAHILIQDFIQGTGWMEKTAMYYGYYDSVELTLGSVNGHNYNYVFPVSYLLTTLAIFLVSLIFMARFTVKSFTESIDNQGNKYQWSNKVFGGWDYGLNEEEVATLKQQSIQKDFVAELEEQNYNEKRENRTSNEKCKLYTIRFFVNFLIVLILGGSGYLIYYVTAWSSEFLSKYDTSDYSSLVILLVQFAPSLTITALNGIVPFIFVLLVIPEDYKPEFQIKLTLIRTVFLRLASLAVLITSLYNAVTCSDKEATCNVGQNNCDPLYCWETHVGQNFYKLIVLDFLVHIAVTFCYELPRKLITTKCEASVLQKIGPAEFDIPKNVLDLLYSQTLCWVGFFYAPLTPAICVIHLFVLFYLKLLSALYNTVPPKRPYKASKSNDFFMIVLMAAFFLCCIPVGYSMVKLEPSKGCGPFRIYNYMIVCMDALISNLPSWLQTIVGIFSSTAFVISLITALSLAIYYCGASAKVKGKMVDRMKEQLILEGRDKQFLINRIYDLTGEKPGPKKNNSQPPPKQPPAKSETVNESKNNDFPSESDTKKYIPNDVPASPKYDSPAVDNQTIEMTETNKSSPVRQVTPVTSNVSTEAEQSRAKSTATTAAVAFDF